MFALDVLCLEAGSVARSHTKGKSHAKWSKYLVDGVVLALAGVAMLAVPAVVATVNRSIND